MDITLIVVSALCIFLFLGIAYAILWALFYKKVPQGTAMVRTGRGGTLVEYDSGMSVVPIIHMMETMDISVKTIEIARLKEDGLICMDNIRADIKVVFFIRVNKEAKAIKNVAQTIGCKRASDPATLRTLFEAKFSEALKTVGKQMEFEQLYDSRDDFKQKILESIGKDLNGYVLDDCAIDYLEQTPIEYLSDNNILDGEGIKKITELTAKQRVKANFIRREEEKTLREQDVEAREAILEYDRQLAEKEERQRREIANIHAREEAEIQKVNEEERLRSELVRIKTQEELDIAEENKLRQVIVAEKNKQRTEVVETERVDKDRLLEQTEKDKIVTLAQIEKTRAVEEEKKNIQDVIRERIMVEKKVVEEEEKIKDTRAIAEADRSKNVAIINAQEIGESIKIEKEAEAQADKISAEINAQKLLIDAEAAMKASEKDAESRKIIAEAKAAEEATLGLSEAQVIEAKAKAHEMEGLTEAKVMEQKAIAEAKGIEAKTIAIEKQGLAEARVIEEQGMAEAKVMQQKAISEARGVEEKAMAMKKLDGVGREHEEFKLRLAKEQAVELAEIDIQRSIADAQALALAEAFKSANIDIVGGEETFINNIMKAIGNGKAVDRLINNSETLSSVKSNLLGGGNLIDKVKTLTSSAGFGTDDIKNLTMAALMLKLRENASDSDKGMISDLMEMVQTVGIGAVKAGNLLK
jgi:flotillin